jgi:nucleoside 2-deoxyribosyltransferase
MGKMIKIYLAHSIHEMKMGSDISAELTECSYCVINPFDMEFNRADVEKIEKLQNPTWSWETDYITSPKKIVENDLKSVSEADVIVAIFPDDLTIGITCEMFKAWELGKIVISIVPKRLIHHPWINYCSNIVFERDEDPCDAVFGIHDYLSGELD